MNTQSRGTKKRSQRSVIENRMQLRFPFGHWLVKLRSSHAVINTWSTNDTRFCEILVVLYGFHRSVWQFNGASLDSTALNYDIIQIFSIGLIRC